METIGSFDDFLNKLGPKTRKSIVTGSEIETIRYPLASRTLTKALSGGIGAGRITTIYGNQSAGKTLLMLQTIGQLQKDGKVCGFVDVEGTFDREFAEKLGVNADELIVSRSKSAGRVSNEISEWIKAGIDLIVIDSISDLMPDVFLDKSGEMKGAEDRKQIGAQARAVKSLISGIHFVNERTAIVLLSQTTTQIEATYTKQIPTGGKSVLFGSSQMIRLTSSNTDAKQIKGLIRKGETLVEEPIGRSVSAIVEKNKLGRQSTVAGYDIYYGGEQIGIDRIGELVDMCIEYGVIEQAGAWFTLEGQRVQGRTAVIKTVKEDSEVEQALEKKLNEVIYG